VASAARLADGNAMEKWRRGDAQTLVDGRPVNSAQRTDGLGVPDMAPPLRIPTRSDGSQQSPWIHVAQAAVVLAAAVASAVLRIGFPHSTPQPVINRHCDVGRA